jgi:hypothetical protein
MNPGGSSRSPPPPPAASAGPPHHGTTVVPASHRWGGRDQPLCASQSLTLLGPRPPTISRSSSPSPTLLVRRGHSCGGAIRGRCPLALAELGCEEASAHRSPGWGGHAREGRGGWRAMGLPEPTGRRRCSRYASLVCGGGLPRRRTAALGVGVECEEASTVG